VVKREKTTCNLLNSTIHQELFSTGIICKFQMIHCIIKNMYANKLFKIGIINYFFICYVSFFGSSAQLRLINFMFMHGNVNLCLCLCLCLVPKLILCAYTNVVRDSLFCGGSGEVAHSIPTNQKLSSAPIFVHSPAGIQHPKRKACGSGWGIPTNKRPAGGCGAGLR
jgi:hypothetical protein